MSALSVLFGNSYYVKVCQILLPLNFSFSFCFNVALISVSKQLLVLRYQLLLSLSEQTKLRTSDIKGHNPA